MEPSSEIGRRDLLIGAVAAATFAEPSAPGRDARIVSLELQTAAGLPEMKRFYHELLGLPVTVHEPGKLALLAGQTRLTFLPAPRGTKPFYHFAFNIPENKIAQAREWQRERTPLIPIPSRLRDPRYPDDVVDYRHWNAHSIFFFDPGGNVVEYIARHDLKNATTRKRFDSKDILCASEIAWVVDDVSEAAERIKQVTSLHQYRGGGDQFRAIGDENGLMLVMKRGRMISFDSPTRKEVDVFPTAAVLHGEKHGSSVSAISLLPVREDLTRRFASFESGNLSPERPEALR